MNLNRLEMLKKFLEEDPDDPFNWYAVALEEGKSDAPKSLQMFEHIMLRWPDYVPVYYQAAKEYENSGRISEAMETLEKGIAFARRSNDHKALRELMTALDALG